MMARGEAANTDYLFCEKNGVYYTLIAVSGFWGAFTYLLRGNTFCNAQTANVVLMGALSNIMDFDERGII